MQVEVYFAVFFSFFYSIKKISQMRMESFPASVPRLSPSFLTFSQTCSSIICNLLQSEEEIAAPW